MNITFHECRYILHLKDYDSGVFFYREVLGLQPNYNWSIVPDQKGYRFYMGSGRLEITQIPPTTTVEAIMDKIAELVKTGKVKEISDMRDETDLNLSLIHI